LQAVKSIAIESKTASSAAVSLAFFMVIAPYMYFYANIVPPNTLKR
jgi:hypothetical protein